jgi:F-type H+-transporting ATPase subunit a
MTSINMFASEAADGPHISIAAEELFHIGPVVITNAFLLGVVGGLLVFWILWATVRAHKRGSRSRFMHAVMWLFENLYDTTVEVVGDKSVARKVLPLAVTIMFFFMLNNWMGLLPIVGPITYDGVPLLRGLAADLNATLAIAVISIVTAQLWAIKRHGFFGNAKRYFFNPIKEPLHFAIGLLEVIAEFSRTAALSLRIFGNVFGGEVLLVVIAYLTSYAAPLALPVFYGLELFVGAVQAYVFFMLTIAFISLGLPNPDEDHGDSHASEEKAAKPEEAKAKA